MTVVPRDKSAAETNVAGLVSAIQRGTLLPVGQIFVSRTVDIPGTAGLLATRRGGGISGQVPTQICQLGRGPVLRFNGCCGIHSAGVVELIGDGISAGIEVAGGANPPSGRHRLDCVIARNCGCGLRLLGTSHADNSLVNWLEVFNTPVAVLSENEQAVNWRFGRLIVNHLGGPPRQTVLDIRAGGLVTIDELISCHHDLQVIQVRDFSPNTCGFTIGRFQFDNYPVPSRLSLFKYAGPTHPENPNWDMRYIRWRVRVLDGFVCPNWDAQGQTLIDLSRWLDVPALAIEKGIDLTDIRWDVRGVPVQAGQQQ